MKNKYTRKVLLSLGMGLLGSIAANAQQKIGNNPGTLNPGAILELESTNRGFLLPRISLTSLSTWGLNGAGTDGMMVYNTNTTTGAGYYVWSGGAWNRIFTGTVAATTNALSYNAGALTSTVNGVGASATIPTANTTTLGLLSAADWNTFNGKQNALTVSNGLTLTGSALTLGGALTAPTTLTLGTQSLTFNASGTAQVIIQGPAGNTAGLRLSNLTGAGTAGTSGQKVLSVNASGDVVLVTDFGTANAGTVTNVTGTAPIVVANGSTTPAISLAPLGVTSAFLADGAVTTAKLAPAGTAGQVLTSTGGTTAPTWQTLPANSNIYTADGTLSGNRTVDQGANNLLFTSTTGKMLIGSPLTNNTFSTNTLSTAGQLAAITDRNSVNAFTVMNDSTSKIGNVASIGFRTQGSDVNYGILATIGAEQTSVSTSVGIPILSDLSFKLYAGIGQGRPERMRIASNGDIRFNAYGSARTIVTPIQNQRILTVDANGNIGVTTDFGSNNAGTVTNVTGTAPITVTNGTTAPVIGINQAALDLASIGGTLPVTKLAAGTTGQTLQIVGTTPTWVTPSVTNTANIYTANGTLSDTRVVTQGGNNLTFTGGGQIVKYSGVASSPALFYLGRTEMEGEFTVVAAGGQGFPLSTAGDVLLKTRLATGNLLIGTGAAANIRLMTDNAERMTITSTGLVGIGTNAPTSTLDVNGSVSFAIRKITQTGATRALGLAAAARTIDATDRTVLVNTGVNPEGIEIILPNPVLSVGREYIIRKMDDSSNPVLFSYPLSGAVPAVTAGGNAILVSEGTTNQFVGSMNFVKTLRIQSNGTNWVLID